MHMERRSMSHIPCGNNKNVFHHCKLSGRWEEKCWRLHLKLHPRNYVAKRRVQKMNPNRDKDLTTSPTQVEEAVQGAIAAHEVHIIIKEDFGSKVTLCYLQSFRRTPSWRCVEDWCTEVNDLGGGFLRIPWHACKHVQALQGCFHVRKQLILARERIPHFSCGIVTWWYSVPGSHWTHTNIWLGFIDYQDGLSPSLRERWEWVLIVEFGCRDCSELRISEQSSALRE